MRFGFHLKTSPVFFRDGEVEGSGGAEAPQAVPEGGQAEAVAEAPAAGPASASAAPKAPAAPKKDWREVRLGEVSAKNRQLERQLQELQAEREALRQAPQAQAQVQAPQAPTAAPKPIGEEELNARAEALSLEREFNSACNRVVAEGRNAHTDFEAKLASFRELGGLPPSVVEAALELEADDSDVKASALLYSLASDPDEALRIFRLSPSRQGAALAKLAKGAQRVQTSQAPEPPGRGLTRGTANAAAGKDPDQMSYAEWEKWREANKKPRR